MNVEVETLDCLKTLRIILDLIKGNPEITNVVLVEKSGMSRTTVQKYIKILKKESYIKREGGNKGGRWIIIKKINK